MFSSEGGGVRRTSPDWAGCCKLPLDRGSCHGSSRSKDIKCSINYTEINIRNSNNIYILLRVLKVTSGQAPASVSNKYCIQYRTNTQRRCVSMAIQGLVRNNQRRGLKPLDHSPLVQKFVVKELFMPLDPGIFLKLQGCQCNEFF